jgi:uncharacterized coiled-coil DUF342 family protein
MMKTIVFVLVALACARAAEFRLECDCNGVVDWGLNQKKQLTVRPVGGSGNYMYDFSGLPVGLSASGSTIAGVPQYPGTYNIGVKSLDDKGNTAFKTITINVAAGGSANVIVNGNQVGTVSSSGNSFSSSSSSTQGSSTITVNADGTVTTSGSSGVPSSSLPNFGASTQPGLTYQFSGVNFVPGVTSPSSIPAAQSGFPSGVVPGFPNQQGQVLGSPNQQSQTSYSYFSSSTTGGSGPQSGIPQSGIPQSGSPQSGSPLDPLSPLSSLSPNGLLNVPSIPGSFGTTSTSSTTSTTGSTTGSTTTSSGSTTISNTTTIISSIPAIPAMVSMLDISSLSQTTGELPSGPSNSYPQAQFPTGTSSDFVRSTVPLQIARYQFPYDEQRDSYKPTPNDIKTDMTQTLAINAIKEMYNALDKINKYGSNMNGAVQGMEVSRKALVDAQNQQKLIQQQIADAFAKNRTLSNQINLLAADVANYQGQLSRLSQAVNSIQTVFQANSTLKNNIAGQITDNNNRLGPLQQALKNAQDAKALTEDNIKKIQQDIASLKTTSTDIQTQIDSAGSLQKKEDDNIKILDDQIADLRAQLERLVNQRNDAKNRSDYFRTLPVTGAQQIRLLNLNITNLQNSINNVHQPNLNNATNSISTLNNQIGQIQATLQDLTARTAEVNNFISVTQTQSTQLNSQIAEINNQLKAKIDDLNKLRAQVPEYSRALDQLYIKGNEINGVVQNQINIYKSFNDKYYQNERLRREQLAILQKARQNKEVASIAFDEIAKRVSPEIDKYAIPGAPIVVDNTYTISGPVLSNGVWVVSGSSVPDGTTIGSTVLGIPIIAGPRNLASG